MKYEHQFVASVIRTGGQRQTSHDIRASELRRTGTNLSATMRKPTSPMVAEAEDTNHGSVLVTLDGLEYLVDPCIGSFEPMPLVPGATTTAGVASAASSSAATGPIFSVRSRC